jgi:hypothetical protein
MTIPQADVFVEFANCAGNLTIPVQSEIQTLDYNVCTLLSVLV